MRLLLTLLVLGSANLRAQTNDPFPDINPHDFYGNMMLSVQVVASGQVIDGGVTIAAFVGDEIRGKGTPSDSAHPGVAYLTVYGDHSGDVLTFKVAAKGIVLQPDTTLSYVFNTIVGTASTPFVLDITNNIPYEGIVIENAGGGAALHGDGRRIAIFDANSEATVSIPLPLLVDTISYERTFIPGQPAAVILPFDITGEMNITGGKFYLFDSMEFEDPEWVVNMLQTTEMEANMPYIVMPEEDHLTFDFGGKPIVMMTDAKTPHTHKGWTFRGTYRTLRWTEPSADYGFPAANTSHKQEDFIRFTEGDYILPLHCYLSYIGEDQPVTAARRSPSTDAPLPEHIHLRLIDKDDSTNGIRIANRPTAATWHTLDGLKLSSKPSRPGLYVRDGRKVAIK